MKPTLLILAAVLLACAALAEDGFPHGGVMGIYFSATEFGPETTNFNTNPTPFSLYITLTDAQVTTLNGHSMPVTPRSWTGIKGLFD